MELTLERDPAKLLSRLARLEFRPDHVRQLRQAKHGPANALPDGIALYPHFQPQIVPGWLDKAFKVRHRATPALDPLVVLVPDPQWVRTLPGGKLPDRRDFKTYGDNPAGRQRIWRGAIAQSQQLADEFARLCEQPSVEALPLP